jgi:hypothetical protein
MKMMEWPIVLTCSLQYWRRKGEWSAILPFYSLDRVGDSEVVDSQPERGRFTLRANAPSCDETA